MCTPSVGIRDDGKGFWVRKGGVDWAIGEVEPGHGYGPFIAAIDGLYASGDTIMEAVDNALAKLRAVSTQGDKQ